MTRRAQERLEQLERDGVLERLASGELVVARVHCVRTPECVMSKVRCRCTCVVCREARGGR